MSTLAGQMLQMRFYWGKWYSWVGSDGAAGGRVVRPSTTPG